ncbi:ATP-binding protein [Clostridium botulinum]|nr:ATP-binding protein [Clostridium botulinum]
MSKYNKAEECRVSLKIDENCKLTKLPQHMTSEEIVSIIGNLIENSLDEVKNDGTGLIYIKIVENKNYLNIIVKDNGSGIPVEYREKYIIKVFNKGSTAWIWNVYSKKIIDETKGTIRLDVDNGVIWNITIPMTRGDKIDSGNDS